MINNESENNIFYKHMENRKMIWKWLNGHFFALTDNASGLNKANYKTA